MSHVCSTQQLMEALCDVLVPFPGELQWPAQRKFHISTLQDIKANSFLFTPAIQSILVLSLAKYASNEWHMNIWERPFFGKACV